MLTAASKLTLMRGYPAMVALLQSPAVTRQAVCALSTSGIGGLYKQKEHVEEDRFVRQLEKEFIDIRRAERQEARKQESKRQIGLPSPFIMTGPPPIDARVELEKVLQQAGQPIRLTPQAVEALLRWKESP